MLQIESCKNNGGFMLWGDYGTLKPIHSFIMDLAEKSPILNLEGITLGLAYDIRKAYESQREKDTIEVWDDTVTIYGVEQVWPTFIAQIALLRGALAFVDTDKKAQSIMYQLESLLYDALHICLPAQAGDTIAQYEQMVGKQEHQVDALLGSRVSYFLSLTKAKRAKHLTEILFTINPMFEHMPHKDPKRLSPDDFIHHSWDTIPDTSL